MGIVVVLVVVAVVVSLCCLISSLLELDVVVVTPRSSLGIANVVDEGVVVDIVFGLDSGVEADVAVTAVAGVVVLLNATVASEESGKVEGSFSCRSDLRSNSRLAFSQAGSVTSLTSM